MASDQKQQPKQQQQLNVLVTGGAGYIGSHTCVELLNNGFHVIVVDNLCNSTEASLQRVEKITGKKIEFHNVNLCDYDKLESVLKGCPNISAVIHFAGLKAVGESVSIPLKYYDNNLVGTLNLLKLMEKYNMFNLIFSSSATVYGDAKQIPIPETAPLSCTNAYGRTKLFIEEVLRDVAKGDSGKNWRIILLRYFNPVGAHESGTIGEDPSGIPNNLMPYISQVAVGKRPHLNVFGNDYQTPDGTGVRDYIHVVDLAKGHLAALSKGILLGKMESNCEAFNLGRGAGISVLELLGGMSKACGKELQYKISDRRPGDVAVSYADASKAKNAWDWQAELGMERMCADTWRWQSMNPDGFKTKSQSS